MKVVKETPYFFKFYWERKKSFNFSFFVYLLRAKNTQAVTQPPGRSNTTHICASDATQFTRIKQKPKRKTKSRYEITRQKPVSPSSLFDECVYKQNRFPKEKKRKKKSPTGKSNQFKLWQRILRPFSPMRKRKRIVDKKVTRARQQTSKGNPEKIR